MYLECFEKNSNISRRFLVHNIHILGKEMSELNYYSKPPKNASHLSEKKFKIDSTEIHAQYVCLYGSPFCINATVYRRKAWRLFEICGEPQI